MKRLFIPILVLTMTVTPGCEAPSERPFLVVQTCLENEQGVDRLRRLLNTIAIENGLDYVDSSRARQGELHRIEDFGVPVPSAEGLINIGIRGSRGFGLTAGNLGLSQYEVAIGFSKGRDHAAAEAFSETVVAALRMEWEVYTVPEGRGAFPLPGCQ